MTLPKHYSPEQRRIYYRTTIKKYRTAHPEYYDKEKDIINKKNRELKARVFSHYGGKCPRCGIDDLRCLCLHHINGNGKEDRTHLNIKTSQSMAFYRHVEKLGYPKDLKILCANCHIIEHSF